MSTTRSLCTHACVLRRFSHVTLCHPMDCSLPSSTVHGILQTRILEWVLGCHTLLQGIFSTQGSNLSLLHLLHWEVCSLPLLPHKKPFSLAYLTKLSLKFALGQNWLKDLVGFGLEFIILGRRKLKNQTCLVWRGLASLGGEGNGTPL